MIRYEKDPELLARYRPWVSNMWETNWFEGNALFTYIALALLPEYRDAAQIAAKIAPTAPHAAEPCKAPVKRSSCTRSTASCTR